LEDFGQDDFEAPLRVQLQAMRDEANLSEAGMQAQLEDMLALICVSLRCQAHFKAHPEIEAQEVVAPVVIVGLQRTGTSKLFRNIAADPQWNVLYTWLGLDPVPPEGWQPGTLDPRLAQAEAWCEGRRWMAKAHGFYPTAPEMEALLMKRTFMLNIPALLIPSHQAWLERADFTEAYRFLRRQLQFLQWQTGAPAGRRWILKSPPHLLTLKALTSVFPDATLVMTHRHPRSSVGSMFKLVEIAQQEYAVTVDRDQIRRVWLRNLSLAISRFMEFRAQADRDVIIDVSFRDFVGDPLPTMKRIYDFAGVRFTQQTDSAARAWERDNPRHSEGKFEYDLADFGATEADIDSAFEPYLRAYENYL
jgi:hypothetical protein